MNVNRNINFKLFFLWGLYLSCCFGQVNKTEEKEIQFQNDSIIISGKLFLPAGEGPFPAVVILQGGSSNVNAHRSTSTYYAYKFVQNGIAALIYDKRGTGDSDGNFSKSTFDDFVIDAIQAIQYLKKQDKINSQNIGVFGPSQGGRIAALTAARSDDITFIATLSTPLVSIADLCYFSSMHFLKQVGITDSIKTIVDPLWRKHYTFVEKADVEGLKELDHEIERLYTSVDTIFLPLTSDKLDHLADFELGDFQPQYNSMIKDYISELSKVKIPWLSIYAEFDIAVPVNASIKIMKEKMVMAGNTNYEIKIIPDADHGFRNINNREYLRVEEIIIDWILHLN